MNKIKLLFSIISLLSFTLSVYAIDYGIYEKVLEKATGTPGEIAEKISTAI